MSPVDVMVLAAHPDDAEFGAAGSVARWTAEGLHVIYVICTNGDKGTSDPTLSTEKLAAWRREEQQAAADVLGVRDVIFLGHPDQGLEDTPQFRKQIVHLLRTYRPKTLVTSDPYRRYLWHRDHRIVGQVAMDAVFPYARDHLAYPDMLTDKLMPHKVQEVLFWAAEDINYRVDISQTFAQKLAALKCHASQIRELKIPDLDEWLKNRCREMAQGSQFELAEAFHRVALPP